MKKERRTFESYSQERDFDIEDMSRKSLLEDKTEIRAVEEEYKIALQKKQTTRLESLLVGYCS